MSSRFEERVPESKQTVYECLLSGYCDLGTDGRRKQVCDRGASQVELHLLVVADGDGRSGDSPELPCIDRPTTVAPRVPIHI